MAQRLPHDLLVAQLEALQLCEALFPLEGELVLSEQTASFAPTLREWLEAAGQDGAGIRGGDIAAKDWADELAFTVNLALEHPDDPASTFPLALAVKLPLSSSSAPSDAPPPTSLHIQQPAWLARTPYDTLAASLPSFDPTSFSSPADLILQAVDYLREEGVKLLPSPADEAPPAPSSKARRRGARAGAIDETHDEFRVWLWFPSLSTREKRDDIVNWAPEYGLTGFVLAGELPVVRKPALLCLEGTEENIQAYLADIKSNSWADIPSFQKKVSERYRTPLVPRSSSSSSPPPPPPPPPSSSSSPVTTSHRIFTSMAEITSLIPRGGQRGNRGEMGPVRDFLASKGLGDAFGAVIGGGQFS
ncbi:hypothetical protein JCM5296_001181 [Sporobolomyces johnsonii]